MTVHDDLVRRAEQHIRSQQTTIVHLKQKLAAVQRERDAYMEVIGHIAAAIPVPDVLAATATIGDLIEYFHKSRKESEGEG